MSLSNTTWKDVVAHVGMSYPDLHRDWFGRLTPRDLANGVLLVQAENGPQLRYLNEHCRRAFCEAAQAAIGRLVSVKFESSVSERETPPSEDLSFECDPQLELSSENIFDNFVTGPCNRLAHAASVAVAEHPGTTYNPLFIHGDVGLGKTHLLQAICHGVRQRNGSEPLNLLYLSCETFTNHFLEAVQRGALQRFRYRYRHVDLLVIDDIQFLGERERSQEEFFHTFNTLYQSQRQIVLSADCHPNDIPAVEERLVSRFNSGLVALVDKPCLETRIAIVHTKAKLRGVDLPRDVAQLIASRIDSNVRELEGALKRIDLLSQTRGEPINIALASDALGVNLPRQRIAITDILNTVAGQYNMRVSDLQGKRRTKSIVWPRQVCMYLARELTNLSLEEIGRYFSGRDHTTVIHAYRLVGSRRLEDLELNLAIEQLVSRLNAGARR